MTAPFTQSKRLQSTRRGISFKEISTIVNELARNKISGRQLTHTDRLVSIRKLVEAGGVPTLEPLLPLCLNLNGEPYHLHEHFPFSPVFKTNMPRKLLLKTGRQVSKCVKANSVFNRVYDEYGRRYPLEDVKPGQYVQSLVVDRFQLQRKPVCLQHKNPVKRCYYIRTRRGVEIELAGTHPLYTYNGFTAVDELDVGSRIAHVREGGFFGRKRVADCRIRVTAYMLGDGSFRGTYTFTAARDSLAIAEMRSLLGEFREYGKKCTKANSLHINQDHVVYSWAAEDGLHGKLAHEKQIPSWVFVLSKNDTRTFIERLWATDGMVKPGAKKATITYTSTSRELVYDLKSLLAKFGIPTSIKERRGAYKKPDGRKVECRRYWVIRVETRDGWQTFLSEFNVPDKPGFQLPQTVKNNNRYTVPREISELIVDIVGECRGTNRNKRKGDTLHEAGLRRSPKYPVSVDKMQAYLDFFHRFRPEHPRLAEFTKYVNGVVDWDEIVEIRDIGEHPCVDIEVEDTHNYLLDGVVSHNSTSLASHGVILSNCIPNFKTLYIAPLYEQIRRFSNNYVRPFIDRSPIKQLWSGTTTENSVLQRTFKNHSMMIFSFALLDADRVRGVSADKVAIDEVQDMDPDHLPIIGETMSHSKWGLHQYTGTPKTLDNPIEGLWRRSSQAEWFVPCYQPGCNTWNIPSMEYHIEEMIGPWHEWISENHPAIICHKCKKPIDPRPPHGRWVHRYRDRRQTFAGYHVPQIIMPLHCLKANKWQELIGKKETTAPNVFYNEVLGESVDAGQKIITETDLRRAADLPWVNEPNQPNPDMTKLLKYYKTRIMAVDWGGGGEDGVSFTTCALMGLTPDNKIHVLWGKRLLTPSDHLREAREIIHWVRQFGCEVVAHDYTGAGTVRETVLVQAGYDLHRIMPIAYVRAASSNLLRPVPATPLHDRAHYRLDKTRSLLYTCQAIKLRMVRFFQYDFKDQDHPGLIADFLALVEEKASSRLGGDIYTITRNDMLTDDFAQSVNIGCAALWHMGGCWPDFAKEAKIAKITNTIVQVAGNRDFGWAEDRSMASFFGQP